MTAGSTFGPFKPGFGGMPPHLAGRQDEQDLFRGDPGSEPGIPSLLDYVREHAPAG